MYPVLFAASLRDRGDAAVALDIGCVGETLTVFPEGREKSRRVDVGGAGEAAKYFEVGELAAGRSDFSIEERDSFTKRFELRNARGP